MAALLRSSLRHYRLLSTTTTTTTVRPLTTSAVEPNLQPQQKTEEEARETPNNVTTFAVEPNLQSHQKTGEEARETPNNVSETEILHYPLDITFRRLAKSSKHAEIEAFIESQKKNPKINQESFFSTLIRSYGLVGMTEQASRLFDQMEELGTPRSAISFNALLSAYIAAWKFDKVPKLFDEILQKHDISPDTISYNILIKSYCKMNNTDEALSVLKQMGDKDIEIKTTHYTLIIDALFKKRKADEAEKLWDDMIGKGCEPDVAAYNVRIGYAHQGKPESVLALIDEMTAKGLKPDTTTYNHLFACYCKNDLMGDAVKVYQDLEENGCSPNATTFRLGILHHCKRENFERAFEVFKESMARDKVPSFSTLRILVTGLAKSSKKEDAKEVIRTVKEKFPGNVLNTWSELELELGLISDEDSPKEEASA